MKILFVMVLTVLNANPLLAQSHRLTESGATLTLRGDQVVAISKPVPVVSNIGSKAILGVDLQLDYDCDSTFAFVKSFSDGDALAVRCSVDSGPTLTFFQNLVSSTGLVSEASCKGFVKGSACIYYEINTLEDCKSKSGQWAVHSEGLNRSMSCEERLGN